MTDPTMIRQAMAELSHPQRALIYRAHHLGRTTAQIASEYRTTETAVRAELHDAMWRLRRALSAASAAV